MSTILAVEDEEQSLRLIEFGLRRKGYDIVTATNGMEALEILNSHHVDLVITDLIMPYMDGLEMIAKMKEDDRFKNLPIVVVSSRKSEKFVMDALRLGVNDFVAKPFNEVELQIRVKRVLI